MAKLSDEVKHELIAEIEKVKSGRTGSSVNQREGHNVDEMTTLLVAALVEEEDSGGH